MAEFVPLLRVMAKFCMEVKMEVRQRICGLRVAQRSVPRELKLILANSILELVEMFRIMQETSL